ncbi:hypothetical protein FJQ98_14395 [Lysinibacillus agricola]|uniref:Lipoprotein n=1 Tax=Lysinibacillus agricola TaxID=2590012 RepID=A0ABX7AQE7_9BACI|nr:MULTISPECIES: hypothetical protein [Lysinibacillus]QQP10474.1 hypothetical protein FJQ98_14395 [Lysinibacillus agricola]
MFYRRLLLLSTLLLLSGCTEETNTDEANKNAVVQEGQTIHNIEKLYKFMEDAKNGKEAEIRVIRHYGELSYDNGQGKFKGYDDSEKNNEQATGKIIYDLKAVHDENAGEKWIEVHSNMDDFEQSEDYPETMIDSQQCAYIRIDEEIGAYMLTECFHAWEYSLLPKPTID